MQQDPDALRQHMVESQLIPRGISDPATIHSMRTVPRHLFVPEYQKSYAYEDGPLPIGYNQTISQPYIVALMTQVAELKSEHVVLEIGTGSGYAAAILSQIVKTVYTVERIPELTECAKKVYEELEYTNIYTKVANGTLGWPEHDPYDAIIVTAGAPIVPESLIGQLKIDGRLIIPVGDEYGQQLVRIRKSSEDSYKKELLELVRFVPLIGEEGWHE